MIEKERLYEMINEREQAASVAYPALMRKVYVWMTLALVITGFAAFVVADSPGWITAVLTNRLLFWGLIIGELGLVLWLTAAINRLSMPMATLMFTLYAVLNGVTMSTIFVAYTLTSIASVFFITAGTFAVMAVVGSVTKTDLTSLGKMLFMALIGLILATVVNIFLQSAMMSYIASYVGVAIFVGLTAYDAQRIKNMLLMADDMSEEAHKIALMGSLSLYLDFINLFLYLLRIFGTSRD